MVAAAAAAVHEQPPTCYICLGEAGPSTRSADAALVRGCACRGTSGWAHLRCMVEAAKSNPASWTDCPVCKHEYHGAVMLGLARAHCEHESSWVTKVCWPATPGDARVPPFAVHADEHDLPNCRRCLLLRHCQMNLANALQSTGGREEARQLYEEVVAGESAELGSEHVDTLTTKMNYGP